ncbi:SusD/RagB family nutrient-binding outer membrane lipoprotein [Flavobacterium branchiarum]|uniref:SusD/RagB family nutrient-binding outer membrane lipoprotein n=1 Tax=Flavobacterium branchiarum TaxID=1114870 RepID=A0ABV5FKY2_9FLAO|nr:SusD/RagB family nutrient-binding outer membrane lipoprotein [Flavobacterium branchiarum]MDN3672710.1 SusD/RagB family nutrient-binding outer membrane lipoprotein [Flavobacterium branchiarum]
MKTNHIKKSLICFGLLTLVGCTDNFNEINSNPDAFTYLETTQDFNHINGPFKTMFDNVGVNTPGWKYQLANDLSGNNWGGYTAAPGFDGANNLSYALSDNWNLWAWEAAYAQVMANFFKVEREAKGKYDEFFALATIIKVQTLHKVADAWGPIVYSKFGTTDPAIGYDSQEEVYGFMFKDLDFAVAELTKRVDAGEESSFNNIDRSSYKGDYKRWVIYANSLRLRLAMRIVKVNPALAKAEAEKAVSQKFGVMTTADDTFIVNKDVSQHPLRVVSYDYNDSRMSADMESIMGGYNDPRMKVYFATSIKYPGEYKGIRTGGIMGDKTLHQDFSNFGKIIKEDKQVVWLNTAEIYFLRAEGALRGWNMGGDAGTFYKAGITASFDQLATGGAADYILDNVKTAKDYVDPVASFNSGLAVNKVTIAWDPAATNEVKLQKIITQKWIANFPDGFEAWSDHRRTGYPKLLPVLNNQSGGKISTELGVRRINFVQTEKDGNPEGLKTGIAKLGGPDHGGTRTWWDTTGPNF